MISIEKEKKIRELLKTGLHDREIARCVGVGHQVVGETRRAIGFVKDIPDSEVQHITSLLKDGMSVSAIECRTKVCRYAIKAIRRTYYLHHRHSDGSDVTSCPTCGAVILPAMKPEPESEHAGNVQHEAHGLLQVVEDLVQLQRLNVIYHPLFYSLACRAEEALNRNEKD